MSSITPLTGRLSEIFTPRLYVVFSSTLLAIGLFITAAAATLPVFLLGRAVAGCGSGGLLSIAVILVLDLASPKRRGLWIGFINAGYTIGVASGAVLAGVITPSLGWVCYTFTIHTKLHADVGFDSVSCSGFRPQPPWFWDHYCS